MLKDWQDAFGHEVYDYYKGKGGYEIIERDDGFFSTGLGPQLYFSRKEDWPELDQKAITYVTGRVLDLGCGAGRHALYLQEKGFDVVGIDNSPRAIEVCRARGLQHAQVLPMTRITRELGLFDTILMFGFGLVGNVKRARWFLRRLYGITSETGRIIAHARDPYQTDLPEHLEYHERNRKKGKMPGEARIRVRYKKYVTPWIDFLMVSQDEMQLILEDTPWKATSFIDGQHGNYAAVIEKR
jgi:SAM-dependent methyltransferase